MPNQLKIEVQDLRSHSYMSVKGAYELDAFIQLIKHINEVGMESDNRRIICDIRYVANMFPSDTDRFRMGTAMAETLGNRIYVAGLATPESINHFVELVANNRGTNFKIFSCADAARQWLLEDDVLAGQKKAANSLQN